MPSMVRRWLIRSFFIALCVLCVGAWMGSYFQAVFVHYFARTHVLTWGAYDGFLDFADQDSPVFSSATWTWRHIATDHKEAQEEYRASPYHFAGFAYNNHTVGTQYWSVQVPLWFLTFISALLHWFVWRKTRPRMAGFPVEPAKAVVDSK